MESVDLNTGRTFIIQKDDEKSAKWAEAGARIGVTLIPQSGSAIKAPFFLISIILRNGIPDGYIVRYLNDYRSWIKTTLRTFSEIALVILCLVFRVKLFWICHNVDREGSQYHPKISKFRRWIFSWVCMIIFVTDKLLVPHAMLHLKGCKERIRSISFGPVNQKNGIDHESEKYAKEFIRRMKVKAYACNQRPLVIFCAGSPKTEKSLHFDYLKALIESAARVDVGIIAVVAGEFGSDQRSKNLLAEYRYLESVCVFENYTRLSQKFISEYVDFYWRGYADFSVPYTLYEAATAKKPVLALRSGFLPEMVAHYRIGSVVSPCFTNLTEALDTLNKVQDKDFDAFFEKNNWGIFPAVLKENFNIKISIHG